MPFNVAKLDYGIVAGSARWARSGYAAEAIGDIDSIEVSDDMEFAEVKTADSRYTRAKIPVGRTTSLTVKGRNIVELQKFVLDTYGTFTYQVYGRGGSQGVNKTVAVTCMVTKDPSIPGGAREIAAYEVQLEAISPDGATAPWTVTTGSLPLVVTGGDLDENMILEVPDGGSANFYVALGAGPAASVDVDIANSAGDASLTVATPADGDLTFSTSNWDTLQEVVISDTAGSVGDMADITISSSGYATKVVTAKIVAAA